MWHGHLSSAIQIPFREEQAPVEGELNDGRPVVRVRRYATEYREAFIVATIVILNLL